MYYVNCTSNFAETKLLLYGWKTFCWQKCPQKWIEVAHNEMAYLHSLSYFLLLSLHIPISWSNTISWVIPGSRYYLKPMTIGMIVNLEEKWLIYKITVNLYPEWCWMLITVNLTFIYSGYFALNNCKYN